MKRNIGTTDKIIRLLIASTIAILYFTKQVSGVIAIVLGIISLILMLTSFINFCPLYTILKINTLKRK
ncbi:MAG: YgaP family membrane protein [Chitinophagaceae bacterium]